jgi:hypothetical protein
MESEVPFTVGERLEYELEWGIFDVGSAILEVKDTTEWNGIPCWHLVFTVQTNSFADKIYKIRTVTESFVTKDLKRTLHYTKSQKEGDTDREIEVHFDWSNNQATYFNHGIQEGTTRIDDNTVDPLGIIYAFRSHKLTNNKRIEIPLTDGKNQIQSSIEIVSETSTKTRAGKFKSYQVIPTIEGIRGIFKKTKDSKIEMWFSQDSKHFPLHIKSKVVVGSFQAKLKSMSHKL